jgi:hypothetical protein
VQFDVFCRGQHYASMPSISSTLVLHGLLIDRTNLTDSFVLFTLLERAALAIGTPFCVDAAYLHLTGLSGDLRHV